MIFNNLNTFICIIHKKVKQIALMMVLFYYEWKAFNILLITLEEYQNNAPYIVVKSIFLISTKNNKMIKFLLISQTPKRCNNSWYNEHDWNTRWKRVFASQCSRTSLECSKTIARKAFIWQIIEPTQTKLPTSIATNFLYLLIPSSLFPIRISSNQFNLISSFDMP